MSARGVVRRRVLRAPGMVLGSMGAALILAISIPLTVAQFSAGFSGTVSATGSVDVAQTPSGDGGQHATAKGASVLKGNGLTINPVMRGSSGWPKRATAAVDVPLVNRSGGAIVPRLRVSVPDSAGDLASYLLFGASIDGAPVGDAPVPLAWFDEHADGLQLQQSMQSGAQQTVTVSVWLSPDAPSGVLDQRIDVLLQVVGETRAGDEPILVEGVWQ